MNYSISIKSVADFTSFSMISIKSFIKLEISINYK